MQGVMINMVNILVVEDDVNLNQSVCYYLRQEGYQVQGCYHVQEAYDEMYGNLYDLIISDIMMPDIDGFEFAQTVRSLDTQIPILFMTARDDIAAKQKGFRSGIDDYMVKPIDFEELLLRISALLRRANILAEKQITIGNLTLDADAMSASVDGVEIAVTVREFNILFKLLSYPQKTFSRAQLMDEFWGMDSSTSLRAVDVYINKLREKFTHCTDFNIVTVHGLGYKVVLVA
jgi:Response regulators consisting of a CheY-like receiver domain and a winged-helix DNA-binding domain